MSTTDKEGKSPIVVIVSKNLNKYAFQDEGGIESGSVSGAALLFIRREGYFAGCFASSAR